MTDEPKNFNPLYFGESPSPAPNPIHDLTPSSPSNPVDELTPIAYSPVDEEMPDPTDLEAQDPQNVNENRGLCNRYIAPIPFFVYAIRSFLRAANSAKEIAEFIIHTISSTFSSIRDYLRGA